MQTTKEPFRPAVHFSPKQQWINDPNGLVYYDGEYHLFYQYHPHDTVWGPMHWGHAVSTDLKEWEELPIALYPDEHGQIFSGSAVVDWHNTSGFQTGEEAVMVAIFTHHGDVETQSLAYSNDRGRTWEKYSGNPVIQNPFLKDFRDPKVFWHEPSAKWVMSLACGDHIRFYGSPNLKNWTYLSSFGEAYGAHGGVWECPDLIELAVEGTDEKKWVLIVSLNPGGPNGGSAIQYFTGAFDGTVFTADQIEADVNWADWGRDFYAAVTWSNTEQPVWIGWMNNWQYANQVPTEAFRGSMSLPRTLSLKKEQGGVTLVQRPVLPENVQIVTAEADFLPHESTKINVSEPFIASWTFEPVTAGEVRFILAGEQGKTVISYNVEQKKLFVDRTESGETDFSPQFPSVDCMPLASLASLLIVCDHGSIELFANDGAAVMTESVYTPGGVTSLLIEAENGNVQLKK